MVSFPILFIGHGIVLQTLMGVENGQKKKKNGTGVVLRYSFHHSITGFENQSPDPYG